jgi:hypothetical protein
VSKERVYLFVPVAERILAQLQGACWDRDEQCWYVDPPERLLAFTRWIPYIEGDELNVISDEASVAALDVPCRSCGGATEVICIHCRGGLVEGVPWRQFICRPIEAVDTWLSSLLETRYPQLRLVEIPQLPEAPAAFLHTNHCVHCGAVQKEEYLEEYWEDPCCWARTEADVGIRLVPIPGTTRLGGGVSLIP